VYSCHSFIFIGTNREVFEDEEDEDCSEAFEVMETIDWHELLAIEPEKPR
jgi:hypothetical protein